MRPRIEVAQAEDSQLWYWRIYGEEPEGMEQPPLVVSNGYMDKADCRHNLDLVCKAILEWKT